MSVQVIGRDAEQQTIGAFLDSVQHGAGALVLAGPAGSGKTTLLRAGSEVAAARGYTVLATTPARSDMRLAFAGLADLLEPHWNAVVGELPRPQARVLGVALVLEEAPAHPPEPRTIATAFRAALAVLARSAPLLIVIDDVQWLDPPSAMAAGFAVRRLDDERVGVLGAQRTDQPGTELPLELMQARFKADLLPVGGLSIGALHRLLRSRLGISFPQPTLRRIWAASEGNPFIALEIGRAIARRGISTAAPSAVPMPDTLSGLVAERLGELQPEVLTALHLVAVMPGVPAERYIAAGAVAADLDAAVAAGVLELYAGRVRFSHPLVGSAVAASIPPGRLRELHAAAAAVSDQVEERARHRALAATGASASVAADLDAAARAAVGRGAPETGAELFKLAASLTPEDQPADAITRKLETARQLVVAGETRAARAVLQDLIDSTAPGPQRAEALSQLASLHEDDLAVATELLQQALAQAGADPGRTADIRLNLSESWMLRGDQARASAEAWRAVADAERAGDPALLAACLSEVFLADFMRGAAVDEHQLDRALELERTIGSSPLRLSPTQIAGIWYFLQGRLDEAEAMQRQALARAEAEGIEPWRAEAFMRLSRVAGRRGDLTQSAELAAEGLEIAEQLDLRRPTIALLYAYAFALLQLGQTDKVRALARRGLELAQQTGDLPYVVCHQALLGSVDLALGDYRAAAARLSPLARKLPEIGWHATTQSIAPDVAEALIATGELDEAGEFLSELQRGMRDPVTAALAARSRGSLAAARGDLGAAVAEFGDALALDDLVSPHPLERARTLLELGSVQRRLKQRAVARATLSGARDIFERCGATLWVARASAELARISGRAAGISGRAAGAEGLTATELRVAELVARGRSNKEAAAEMFITVRAIESTLTKVYAKLGVRSRTELAARLSAAAAGRTSSDETS